MYRSVITPIIFLNQFNKMVYRLQEWKLEIVKLKFGCNLQYNKRFNREFEGRGKSYRISLLFDRATQFKQST